MIYFLFKIINPDKSIGFPNLNDEIEKSTLAKLVNNIKDILDYMSSNYSINIDTGEYHEDYCTRIFRDPLTGPNSTFDFLVKRLKIFGRQE